MCGRRGPGRFSPTTVLAALTLMVLAVGLLVTAADAAGPGNSLSAKQCQKDGWKSLIDSSGHTYANGGDCVSYAARGGELRPQPFPEAQALCQSYGGTFGVGRSDFTGGYTWD